MNGKRMLLWDLPTRLFHWTLVLAVVAAIISGQLGGKLIDWHGRIGLLIVGLVSKPTRCDSMRRLPARLISAALARSSAVSRVTKA